MSQSKKMSLVESCCNVGSGFVIAYLAWLFVVPTLFDIPTRPGRGLGVTLFFTVISIARGYVWRRLFTRRER